MRYTIDKKRREDFRDYLRGELRRMEFYRRRQGHYEVSEFSRYAETQGANVEEVSLGRYTRMENPVLPTPESCRELAKALGVKASSVLIEAGYLLKEETEDTPITPEMVMAQIDSGAFDEYIRDRLEGIRENSVLALAG